MRVGENAIMKTRPSICALCHRPLDGGERPGEGVAPQNSPPLFR
ncbi:hypothetical protein ABIB95_004398 [Bradyrhizobium sp. LA2.1]